MCVRVCVCVELDARLLMSSNHVGLKLDVSSSTHPTRVFSGVALLS